MNQLGRPGHHCMRKLTKTLLSVALLIGGVVALGRPAAAEPRPPDPGRQTFTGFIDGAEYRVETPERWNGTLLLYSHGYYPPTFPVTGVKVTNADETETWLLDHGYALAASSYKDVTGYQVEQGYRDQLALVDWFEANVGEPERLISVGQSMGAAVAVRLGEQRPDLVDGVATVCAAHDPHATFNGGLDVTFAVKTLLAPGQDIDLVHSDDPEGDTAELAQAVDEAVKTPQGRARLALVASLNNISGWWSALQPRPTDPDEVIRQQANWIRNANIIGFAGPSAHADLEARVGGNPSSNVGVDYRHQLTRSAHTRAVKDAYRRAGLDLGADLAQLNAAPRIAADQAAVDFMFRTSAPTGRIRVPVVTLHSVGDGGAVPDQDRWYAGLVRRESGGELIRSLWIERGQHCSFSGADEVVTIQALERRLDTGRWSGIRPRQLNAEVAGFAPELQQVLDLSTFPFPKEVMPPAFVNHKPPVLLRPSR